MEQKEIIEGNVLIAQFMGAISEQWYPVNVDIDSTGIHLVFPRNGDVSYPDNLRQHPDSCLKYHNDWNWLMPVVEQISAMDFSVNIKPGAVTIIHDNQVQYEEGPFDPPTNGMETVWYEGKDTLHNTWRAVVAFIKWHNAANPTL